MQNITVDDITNCPAATHRVSKGVLAGELLVGIHGTQMYPEDNENF